jgi:hypothetical protein
MSESRVADIASRELPKNSALKCEFKDGVWEIMEVQKGVWGVSSVTTNADGKVFVTSTNATRVVLRVRDVDGKVEQITAVNADTNSMNGSASNRHLTEAQVLAIAKPMLPLPAGESYHANFSNGIWEVFTEPDGVQVRGGTVVLVQDIDGKTQVGTRF